MNCNQCSSWNNGTIGNLNGNSKQITNMPKASLPNIKSTTVPSLEEIASYAPGTKIPSIQDIAAYNVYGVEPSQDISNSQVTATKPENHMNNSSLTDNVAQNSANEDNLQALTYSNQPAALSSESLQYMNGFLRTQIGRLIRVEFLIGTSTMVERTGILVGVGANYILINEIETDDLLICDFYNIKFIRFYY